MITTPKNNEIDQQKLTKSYQGFVPISEEEIKSQTVDVIKTELLDNSNKIVLPFVLIEQKLTPSQKNSKGTMIFQDFLIKNIDEEIVGEFTLNISISHKQAYLNTINTHAARGNGYGRATYLKIIEYLKQQNICLISSTYQLSRNSKKIRDWLVSEGKAYITDPGEVNEGVENAGYSTTQYKTI